MSDNDTEGKRLKKFFITLILDIKAHYMAWITGVILAILISLIISLKLDDFWIFGIMLLIIGAILAFGARFGSFHFLPGTEGGSPIWANIDSFLAGWKDLNTLKAKKDLGEQLSKIEMVIYIADTIFYFIYKVGNAVGLIGVMAIVLSIILKIIS
ncbi:MAG: hypothetical protein PHE67_05970 [Campylobacterales bacterium]|nr:hypothetical protein [Campylobacterales bacterium]